MKLLSDLSNDSKMSSFNSCENRTETSLSNHSSIAIVSSSSSETENMSIEGMSDLMDSQISIGSQRSIQSLTATKRKISDAYANISSSSRFGRTTNTKPVVKNPDQEALERQRKIKLHLFLLQHSSACKPNCGRDNLCQSVNCSKMKEFIKHDLSCPNRSSKNDICQSCTRFQNLVQLHALSCTIASCEVPHCNEFRNKQKDYENLSVSKMDCE